MFRVSMCVLSLLIGGCVQQKTFHFMNKPVDGMPVLKHAVAPDYPRALLQQGIEGYVMVEFTVGVDGKPKNLIVIEDHPKGKFSNSATKAIQQYQYQPAYKQGMAVESERYRTVVSFILHGGKRFSKSTCENMTSAYGLKQCQTL